MDDMVDVTWHDQNPTKSATFFGTDEMYKVQCFPIYSILLAVERTEIDYFSLDVEGSEYKILKTIPWHKIEIKVYFPAFFLYL
jgi:hypothetical protein